jgi:hypothetical protein
MLKIFYGFLLFLTTGIACAESKFMGTASDIPAAWQKQMIGRSWNPGCPVALNELSYLTLSYWGFDQKPHVGTLIIHKTLAPEAIAIFKTLYLHHYPIQEMKPYATYPVGEYADHNDTVGFYCRPAQDKPSELSSHAYGIAIDINPKVNPYNDFIAHKPWPLSGKTYMDRNLNLPGMIKPGDIAFNAFTNHGWEWGGFWLQGTDYMHFTKKINAQYVVEHMRYRANNSFPKMPE